MFKTALPLSRSNVPGVFAAALLATTLFATTALAITPEELKAKGTATIGVQMDQFPWGFIDQNGQNDGFDIEIAKLIAKELGVEVKFERITGQNRIPLLVNGNVDFLVPSMTITEERAKVIQYVIPYSSNDITVWAKKDAAIKGNDDLGKYVIGVNR
ncbi:hypothetical protein N183_38765, partial [Sinorhizobium sp. Sb3]|uniref:transporter substrate-binding domain-containing protein n=1 Tax=Sinorhizobium sp. Sb3 TaxID=1358417 RepID=UPI00072655AB